MRNLLSILTISLLSISVWGQSNFYSLGYNMATPTGALQDFSDEASFRGFSFDYHRLFDTGLSVGGSVSWNIFSEKFPRETYHFDGGAINIKQWRYTHVVPMTVSAQYSFLESGGPVQIFAGFGNGLYYVNQEIWAGLKEIRVDSWRYGLYPEAGIQAFFNDSFGLLFSTKYQWVVSGHLDGNDNLGFWDFRIGVIFAN